MKNNYPYEEYRRNLLEALNGLDVHYFESGGTECVTRCPWCGDSRSNFHKGHLYIQMNFNPGEPAGFRCVKCETAGYVDNNFLQMLEIDNNELVNSYNAYTRSLGKLVTKQIKHDNVIRDMKIPMPLNNNISLAKIDYINKRLGLNITGKDIERYKIIFNPLDFLLYNKIDKFTRHEMIMKMLDQDYIGFLSLNKEFITFRNIGEYDEKYRKRYINYNIFGLEDNTKNFYTISNKIDIMKNNTFILTEGIMDILGVFNHVEECKTKNRVYCASLGVGYYAAIIHFLTSGLIFNDKIKIYSDSDQPLDKYRQLKDRLKYKTNATFEIYYNQIKPKGAKKADFGVPNELISPKKIII